MLVPPLRQAHCLSTTFHISSPNSIPSNMYASACSIKSFECHIELIETNIKTNKQAHEYQRRQKAAAAATTCVKHEMKSMSRWKIYLFSVETRMRLKFASPIGARMQRCDMPDSWSKQHSQQQQPWQWWQRHFVNSHGSRSHTKKTYTHLRTTTKASTMRNSFFSMSLPLGVVSMEVYFACIQRHSD